MVRLALGRETGDQVCALLGGGGYAQYARLDAKWVIPLPGGLSLRESMILGTAGFTAALALYRMRDNRQTPDLGPLAVTGATGGIGLEAAQRLVDRCVAVSPATHPPCNVANPCEMIQGEIDRSCDQYAPGEAKPSECAA